MLKTIKTYLEEENKGELLLVHAFNPLAKSSQSILAITDNENSPEDSQRQAIDILKSPERIHERVSLSMSLIETQNKNKTWGNAGYIISVPDSDVISTSTSDNGSRNSNIKVLTEELRRNRANNAILSPEQLIKETSENQYNEVLAFAQNAKIIGCFVKFGPDGEPIDKELASQIRIAARKLSVDVREIHVGIGESDLVAKSFRDVQIISFSDKHFIGFVEGEGVNAVKYNINISKTDSNIISKNLENWKVVSGKGMAKDWRRTSDEKTLKILKMALEKSSINDEQKLAINISIQRIEEKKQKENTLLSTSLQPSSQPSSQTSLRNKENNQVGCFSFISNLFSRQI